MEMRRTLDLTTLVVTRVGEEAPSLSDEVVLLNDGRIGRRGAQAPVDAEPGTAYASTVHGAANLVPARTERGT